MLASASALSAVVAGKLVVITGASEGIGACLARRLAAAGARVALVARSLEKLEEVREGVRADGGEAYIYTANLSSEHDCDRVLREILSDHGHVDIFVSNAGRSIRRSVKYQGAERFHDFQRLMALNYFGALRLILGVLPGMEERRAGHVVHVSSFGVPTRQPRFAGYCASKAALDAALQCAAGEVAARGVHMSTVYMPLVQTKMVESKGHSYDHVSMLSVDEACEYIEHAIVTKRAEVIDAPSRFLSLVHIFRPSLIDGLNSLVYRLEDEKAPDDAALKARSPSQDHLLRFLASIMWLFSRLDLASHLRLGVPLHFCDAFTMLGVTLVLIVQPICAAAFCLAGAARRRCGGRAPPEDGTQAPTPSSHLLSRL